MATVYTRLRLLSSRESLLQKLQYLLRGLFIPHSMEFEVVAEYLISFSCTADQESSYRRHFMRVCHHLHAVLSDQLSSMICRLLDTK